MSDKTVNLRGSTSELSAGIYALPPNTQRGRCAESAIGFPKYDRTTAVSYRLADTQQGVREKAVKTEPAAMPPDVVRYVAEFDLEYFLTEALEELSLAFEGGVSPRLRVFCDPSDASETLFVELPVSSLTEGREMLAQFSYDWWYDRAANYSHLVGFRLIKDLGN